MDLEEWVWDESIDWDDKTVLLVLPRTIYEYWVRRLDVLDCGTWGDVRDIGDDVYSEVLGLAGYGTFEEFSEHLEITGEAPLVGSREVALDAWQKADHRLPGHDDEFAANDIPAVADGDWPADVRYLMNEYLPEEILRKQGTTYMTVMNGVYAELNLADREAILQSLTSLGALVVREPGLARFVEPRCTTRCCPQHGSGMARRDRGLRRHDTSVAALSLAGRRHDTTADSCHRQGVQSEHNHGPDRTTSPGPHVRAPASPSSHMRPGPHVQHEPPWL